MDGSSRAETNAGSQIAVRDRVQATGVRAGGLYHQNLVSHGFKVSSEVHAAFYDHDALTRRFNADVPEDCLIEALTALGTDDNANVR
jgi:hypothetical protein